MLWILEGKHFSETDEMRREWRFNFKLVSTHFPVIYEFKIVYAILWKMRYFILRLLSCRLNAASLSQHCRYFHFKQSQNLHSIVLQSQTLKIKTSFAQINVIVYVFLWKEGRSICKMYFQEPLFCGTEYRLDAFLDCTRITSPVFGQSLSIRHILWMFTSYFLLLC